MSILVWICGRVLVRPACRYRSRASVYASREKIFQNESSPSEVPSSVSLLGCDSACAAQPAQIFQGCSVPEACAIAQAPFGALVRGKGGPTNWPLPSAQPIVSPQAQVTLFSFEVAV